MLLKLSHPISQPKHSTQQCVSVKRSRGHTKLVRNTAISQTFKKVEISLTVEKSVRKRTSAKTLLQN